MQLGFLQLASSLGVVQALLGNVIEPTVGAYSELTFVAGAIVLMAGAVALYRALPRHTLATLHGIDTVPYNHLRSTLTFLVELGVGSDLNLLIGTVPKTAHHEHRLPIIVG